MKIIGLDLSITATGVALPDGTTWTLATRTGEGDWRLEVIAASIRQYVELHRADVVVIEGPVVRSSAATVIGMVHGAVRVELLRAKVPYVIVSPATLKKFATGKGTADKTAMALAAFKRAGREFPDDNQCDAWWLQQAGHCALGDNRLDMPQAQRAVLSTVSWPTLTPAQVAS